MARRRIAVAGSGIAGPTAAYVLSRSGDVTLLEADDRLGGHAHTHQVADAAGPDLYVDSGFIVHNKQTYPLLTRLFAELGVAVQDSEMSMSVSCAGCDLEYAGQRGLAGLAAGRRRGRLRYARMLGEVLRFHRSVRRLLASGGQRDQPARAEPPAASSRGRHAAARPDRPARRVRLADRHGVTAMGPGR